MIILVIQDHIGSEEATNGHSFEHFMMFPGEMETWRRCYSGLCSQRLSRIVPERRLGVTNDLGHTIGHLREYIYI